MKSQNKLLFWLAIVNFLTVPYMYFDSISSLFLDSGWMGLAIVASALERYGAIIRLKLFKEPASS